jgi:hypothetical protein
MPDVTRIVATDCGSTTTKAILIERRDGEYHLAGRGEAPAGVAVVLDHDLDERAARAQVLFRGRLHDGGQGGGVHALGVGGAVQ